MDLGASAAVCKFYEQLPWLQRMGALESDKHSTSLHLWQRARFCSLKRLLLFWAASSTRLCAATVCWGILIHCSSLSKRRSNDPIFLSECAATKITRQAKSYVSFWPKQMLFYCVVAPKSCSPRSRLCGAGVCCLSFYYHWHNFMPRLANYIAGVIGSYFRCMLGLRPIWLADQRNWLGFPLQSSSQCLTEELLITNYQSRLKIEDPLRFLLYEK